MNGCCVYSHQGASISERTWYITLFFVSSYGVLFMYKHHIVLIQAAIVPKLLFDTVRQHQSLATV